MTIQNGCVLNFVYTYNLNLLKGDFSNNAFTDLFIVAFILCKNILKGLQPL